MSISGVDRTKLGRSHDVLPASQYLQERLQERRSRVTRPRRSRHTDLGPKSGRDDDIFFNEAEESRKTAAFNSSPLTFNGRASEHGSTDGSNRRRALGIRDMDSHIDKLSKENFDLKMELDHRREHTRKLQAEIEAMKERVERAELLAEEHAELIRINLELIERAEQREAAVFEATEIICDLEERVAELEERTGNNTRPSTAHADSGYAGTETQETLSASSPPRARTVPRTPHVNISAPSAPASAASQKLHGMLGGQTPGKSRRQPFALSQRKPSTQALRSVFLESTNDLRPVKSFHSLLSKQGSRMDEEEEVSSPRLSVLSESSFPSLYSPQKHVSPDRYAWEEAVDDAILTSPLGARAHLRQDSMKRVSQWISERDAVDQTPSKSNNISAPLSDNPDMRPPLPPKPVPCGGGPHFQSLNDALTPVAAVESPPRSRKSRAHKQKLRIPTSRPTSFGGPMFGEPLLPPTPDSASTRMLRASRSSIADDRSLLDMTPAPVKGYKVLEPGARTAPKQMRSSVELSTAFVSNLEYRNTGFVYRRESSSDEDDVGELASLAELGEFGMNSNPFPDGSSILRGTPSRLLKLSASPTIANANPASFSTSPEATRSHPHRRRSSAEIYNSAAKPRLARVETSPNFVGSLGKADSGPKTSVESVMSPRSMHSGSSGNRTIVQADAVELLGTSPPEPTRVPFMRSTSVASPGARSRTSPSPARTLSQKTHSLFRRLSNSQASERPDWEKSPGLPTLTSTPSSAYVNHEPPKRPRTSHGDNGAKASGASVTAGARPPSSRERRPSLQSRTKTESDARPGSAVENHKEKKNLFRRSNSHKMPATEFSGVGTAQDTPQSSGNGVAGGIMRVLPKRRGSSVRDVVGVAGRRQWR